MNPKNHLLLKEVPEQGTSSTASHVSDEKTAIVIGKENLLGYVVEQLLDSVKNWKTIRMTEDVDKKVSVTDIKNLNPEIVILCQKDQSIEIELLMRLLDECPGLKVVTVEMESNSIQVYSKQRVWIKNSAEFLSIVE